VLGGFTARGNQKPGRKDISFGMALKVLNLTVSPLKQFGEYGSMIHFKDFKAHFCFAFMSHKNTK